MTQASIEKQKTDGPPAVGEKLQSLRQAHKLSLDELSRRAGVSKSMLSQIERNQSNPTVAVLWRLAKALGMELADFLTSNKEQPGTPAITLVTDHATPVIRSPDRKCELKILAPIEQAGKVEWYKLNVEPGGVLFSEGHEAGSMEHLTVFSGHLSVKSGDSEQKIGPGETARYRVDIQHSIANPGKSNATALLVVEFKSS